MPLCMCVCVCVLLNMPPKQNMNSQESLGVGDKLYIIERKGWVQ